MAISLLWEEVLVEARVVHNAMVVAAELALALVKAEADNFI